MGGEDGVLFEKALERSEQQMGKGPSGQQPGVGLICSLEIGESTPTFASPSFAETI